MIFLPSRVILLHECSVSLAGGMGGGLVAVAILDVDVWKDEWICFRSCQPLLSMLRCRSQSISDWDA